MPPWSMIKSSNFLVVFASCLCCELCIWPFLCDVLSDFQLSTQKRMKNIFWRAGGVDPPKKLLLFVCLFTQLFSVCQACFFFEKVNQLQQTV